ncbi:MAG: glycosyltransferase [Pseudomonadota bacterium]
MKQSISLVMRSYNDIDVIEQTLDMVMRQRDVEFDLWNFDSSSSDGTRAVIERFNAPERIVLNDSKTYNPGRVLNEAVRRTNGDIVAFINSDATPQDEYWLANIVAPLAEEKVAATFGRQVARGDCRSLFVKDTERAFGDGEKAARWAHFFSMATSAARRDALEQFPFETKIQYSEDIEWSYRLKREGFDIRYVESAIAAHSHNYTLGQSYRRHFGEGKADAWIFREGEVDTSFFRYALLPFGMEVLRDWFWAAKHRSFDAVVHSVPLRFAQKWGRWQGLLSGLDEYRHA